MRGLGLPNRRQLWLFAPILAALYLAFQGLQALVATGLNRFSQTNLAANLVASLPIDDVHALVGLSVAGNVSVSGVAVADPVGDLLNRLAPEWIFSSSTIADGSWVTPIFSADSTLIAVYGTGIIASAIFLFAAVALASRFSPERSIVHMTAWTMGGYGLFRILTIPWTTADLETMGLSTVATKILQLNPIAYADLVAAWDPFLPLSAKAVVLGVISVVLVGLVVVWRSTGAATIAPARSLANHRALVLPFIAVLYLLPFQGGPVYAAMDSGVETATEFPLWAPEITPNEPRPAIVVENEPTGIEFPAFDLDLLGRAGESPAGPPSVVTVTPGPPYQYLVNGVAQRVHCVGYNVPPDDGVIAFNRRMERDFALMRRLGVNTIVGWDQSSFDAVLMAKARRHGIGVILPFEFNDQRDYSDPAVRRAVEREVQGWVESHRDDPALRMWGLGNEILHHYQDPDGPESAAFAGFLVELADLVHRLDPNHPVIYRDAEEVFLAPVLRALQENPADRPSFVYGMNYFTNRINETLTGGDNVVATAGLPLLVSEFGPAGLRAEARPRGYLRYWNVIQRNSARVLARRARRRRGEKRKGPQDASHSSSETDSLLSARQAPWVRPRRSLGKLDPRTP